MASECSSATPHDNTDSEATRLRQPGLAHAQPAKCSGCGANLIAKGGEFFASHFEVRALSLCPLLCDRLQATVSTGDMCGGGLRKSGMGEGCLQPALHFGQLCQDNFLCRNAPQLSDETDFGQRPDN